ncbi:MAG: tetratricopeptide repeat protein [Ferruginibacter sp.]|nr:tetratricopeptide repeat protein [Ferruginibacter sp.]
MLLMILLLCESGRSQHIFKQIPGFINYADSNSYKAALDYIIENSENKTEECLAIALSLVNRSELGQLKKHKALLVKNTGVLYDYKGNLDSTLYYLNLARDIFKQLKNGLEESHVVNNIAVAYYLRGIYELAVKNHLAALSLRQKAGSLKHIAQSYNNLGLLYRAKKDYNSAIEMYNKSLAIKQQQADSTGQLNTLMNIGACYSSWGKFDSSLAYSTTSEQLARTLGKVEDVIGSKANKASALVNLGRLDEGIKLAKEVLTFHPADTKTLLTLYETLSDASLQEKNYQQALQYTQMGASEAEKANRIEQMAVFYQNLSTIYEVLNHSPKALYYLKRHQQITDSLYKEENSRQINEMAAVFESGQKEALIGKLNESLTVKELSVQNRKKERNIFIAASAIFLLLSILLLKAYRQIRKNKNELSQKNAVIESSLKEKETLMKEIHHRVKNNLQLISSLLNMQTDFVGDEKAIDAIVESRNRVMSMSLIHQNLYQQNDITSVNLKAYTEQLCSNILTSYQSSIKPVNLKTAAPDVLVDVDKLVPVGLIINELITNAVKYAFASQEEPKLNVALQQQQQQLVVSVEDNGPGFDFDSIKHRNSFGYKIINAFLKKLKGDIKTGRQHGFVVQITIPDFFKQV